MNRLIFKKFIISLLIISFSFAAMLSITALIANNNKKASTPIPSVNSATVSNWDAQEIHLKDVGDLKNFRDKVNSGKTFKGQTIYLDNDIDLSKDTNSKDNWIPIGFSYDNRTSATWVTHKNRFSYSNTSIYFSGTFNGQNHTISGLTINETYYTYTGTPRAEQNDETYNKFPFNNPDQNAWKSYYHMYSGLFGYLYNASVSNLFIDSPTITLNGQKIRDQNRQDTYIYYNQGDVGVFAGRMAYKSSLSRCMITGTAKIQVASDLPSRIGKVSTDIFAHYTNGIGGFVGVMDKTCIIERSIIESIHFDVDSYINRAAAYTDAEYEYLAVGGMVGLLTEAFTYTGYTSDIKSVNIDYTYIKSIDGECRSHDMENYHYDLTDNNVYVWNNDNIFGSYYGNIVGLVKRLESNYDLNFISHGGAPDVKVTMPKDGNAQFESQSNLFGGGYTFEIVKGHLSDSKWEFTKDDPVDCANTISWFGGECAKGITKAFSLYADYSSGQRMGVPYQYVFVADGPF